MLSSRYHRLDENTRLVVMKHQHPNLSERFSITRLMIWRWLTFQVLGQLQLCTIPQLQWITLQPTQLITITITTTNLLKPSNNHQIDVTSAKHMNNREIDSRMIPSRIKAGNFSPWSTFFLLYYTSFQERISPFGTRTHIPESRTYKHNTYKHNTHKHNTHNFETTFSKVLSPQDFPHTHTHIPNSKLLPFSEAMPAETRSKTVTNRHSAKKSHKSTDKGSGRKKRTQEGGSSVVQDSGLLALLQGVWESLFVKSFNNTNYVILVQMA